MKDYKLTIKKGELTIEDLFRLPNPIKPEPKKKKCKGY